MRFGHGELHLVLLAPLSTRPMHGYDLMGELNNRLGRRYKASPGSIYPAVQALEAEGLIGAIEDGDKRTYALTPDGIDALNQRIERLTALEERIGVRFIEGVEAELSRFTERVRAVASSIEDEALIAELNETASRIEKLARQGG
jgi:DNA-binding PadR family transcriptional regulator